MGVRHPALLASLLVSSAALLLAGPACPQAQLVMAACEEAYTVFRERESGWERRIALRFVNNGDAIAAGQARAILVAEGRLVDCPLEAIPPGESHDVIWVPRTPKVVLSITAQGGAVINQALDLPEVPGDKSVLFPRSSVLHELPPLAIRGTNYLPRDHPWPGLWREATPDDFEADFALMARLGINTIRTFTWYDPDQPNAKLGLYFVGGCATATALKRLADLLTIADRNHVKVILMTGGDTLIKDLPGARRTFKSVFGPLVDDGRILMIDVLNEPGGELGPKASPEISAFLTTMYPCAREFMPSHLLTVGLAWQFDQLFDLGIYPDIAQYHEYSAAVGLPVAGHPEVRNIADGLGGVQRIVGNRPILIGEFGHSTAGEANGGVTEERQREIYQGVLEGAENRRILGVANWCLFDFVPDWMGKKEQHFGIVRADGSLKPAGTLLQQTYLRWRQQHPAPWDAH